MLRQKLKDIYNKEQLFPGFIGLFCNPFYFARKGLAENIQRLARQMSGKILDIGCGSKPYLPYFSGSEYIGLEIDTPRNRKKNIADKFYDGNSFPFNDAEFDAIFSSQVFEHVFNPEIFLKELNRVLKPGGKLLITVPFIWDEHEQPHDFARYSSYGLRSLLEKHGFEIIEHKRTMNDLRVIFQMANAYLFKILDTDKIYLNLLTTLIFMAPLNVLGSILGRLLPKNNDLYLDNIFLAKKVKDD